MDQSKTTCAANRVMVMNLDNPVSLIKISWQYVKVVVPFLHDDVLISFRQTIGQT